MFRKTLPLPFLGLMTSGEVWYQILQKIIKPEESLKHSAHLPKPLNLKTSAGFVYALENPLKFMAA
jgi:hypothetical protein